MGNPFVFQLAKSVGTTNGFMTKPMSHKIGHLEKMKQN